MCELMYSLVHSRSQLGWVATGTKYEFLELMSMDIGTP